MFLYVKKIALLIIQEQVVPTATPILSYPKYKETLADYISEKNEPNY